MSEPCRLRRGEGYGACDDAGRDFLRRSHVLVVCRDTVTEAMKNDIATAEQLHITAASSQSLRKEVNVWRLDGRG